VGSAAIAAEEKSTTRVDASVAIDRYSNADTALHLGVIDTDPCRWNRPRETSLLWRDEEGRVGVLERRVTRGTHIKAIPLEEQHIPCIAVV